MCYSVLQSILRSVLWSVLRSVLWLTSCERRSSGSKICHPRRSRGLGPGSSQRTLHRTHHSGAERAESHPPPMPRTAVAVNNNNDKHKKSTSPPQETTITVYELIKAISISSSSCCSDLAELQLLNIFFRLQYRSKWRTGFYECAVSVLRLAIVTLKHQRGL